MLLSCDVVAVLVSCVRSHLRRCCSCCTNVGLLYAVSRVAVDVDVARLFLAGTSRVAVGATGCCTRACPYRECGERAAVRCLKIQFMSAGCAVRMETKNCELHFPF